MTIKPSTIKLSANIITKSLGLSLILSFFSHQHLISAIPVHQLDSSCSSFCGDQYHSLKEWTSCARGCRFFSLIQILAKPQSLDATQKSCLNTCNEAYNETQLRKACSSGCRKSIEMITSAKTGHSNSEHQLLSSAEQWIHHLGMSPFEETVESPHHEFTWPFHFLNDIYKQLTDQITSSTNWIKSRSTYTLMFGNGSNGRQIFLVRARPHLTVNPSLSHSNLAINPIHEQSTFHVIAFPSVSSASTSSSSSLPSSSSHFSANKQIKLSASPANIVPTNRINYQTDQSQSFARWVTDTSQTIVKDLRLLMALLLAIVVLSIVTFSDGLCWSVDRTKKQPSNQEKAENTESTAPFFILNNSLKSEKELLADDVKREEMIQEENERPPTYDETIKTSALNFASLASSRESKA